MIDAVRDAWERMEREAKEQAEKEKERKASVIASKKEGTPSSKEEEVKEVSVKYEPKIKERSIPWYLRFQEDIQNILSELKLEDKMIETVNRYREELEYHTKTEERREEIDSVMDVWGEIPYLEIFTNAQRRCNGNKRKQIYTKIRDSKTLENYRDEYSEFWY